MFYRKMGLWFQKKVAVLNWHQAKTYYSMPNSRLPFISRVKPERGSFNRELAGAKGKIEVKASKAYQSGFRPKHKPAFFTGKIENWPCKSHVSLHLRSFKTMAKP